MIFIIGGNGFVGSAITKEVKSRGMEYQILTRESMKNFINAKCDILINANGNSKKFLAKDDPMREFDESVRSVRESLANIQYGKYIYLSTCDVYNDCTSPENTNEKQSIDIEVQSTYGFHKYLAEQCVKHVAENWLIFRMGGFVGEGLKKNAIYDILNGGPLWLDPMSELQFISTKEAAKIIVDLASSSQNQDIYNLCGKGVIRLKDILDQFKININAKENCPKVRYEVSIEKLSKVASISNTYDTVMNFVKENM